MVICGARGAPLFEVGPAPRDRAWSQVHWSRKRTGDQPVDGRAAQASGLDHRGQRAKRRAGSAVSRVAGARRFMRCRRTGDVGSVGAVVWHRSDGFSRNVIGGRFDPMYGRPHVRSPLESNQIPASGSIVARGGAAPNVIIWGLRGPMGSRSGRGQRPGHAARVASRYRASMRLSARLGSHDRPHVIGRSRGMRAAAPLRQNCRQWHNSSGIGCWQPRSRS
jgi:hypothetical protein